MTTKGKKETRKFGKNFRITTQVSSSEKSMFKEGTKVKSVKGTRRGTRR